MSGQIFISYRREEAAPWARLIKDRLFARFPTAKIVMDVDAFEIGRDYVEEIEKAVESCDILIAVIGKSWLTLSNTEGSRRLEITGDPVRREIATALKRGIRVFPLLVEGASMPHSSDLPEDLKSLARINALEVSHNRFGTDTERLIAEIKPDFEKADAGNEESPLAIAKRVFKKANGRRREDSPRQ